MPHRGICAALGWGQSMGKGSEPRRPHPSLLAIFGPSSPVAGLAPCRSRRHGCRRHGAGHRAGRRLAAGRPQHPHMPHTARPDLPNRGCSQDCRLGHGREGHVHPVSTTATNASPGPSDRPAHALTRRRPAARGPLHGFESWTRMLFERHGRDVHGQQLPAEEELAAERVVGLDVEQLDCRFVGVCDASGGSIIVAVPPRRRPRVL
jgi:hypothetical protein